MGKWITYKGPLGEGWGGEVPEEPIKGVYWNKTHKRWQVRLKGKHIAWAKNVSTANWIRREAEAALREGRPMRKGWI